MWGRIRTNAADSWVVCWTMLCQWGRVGKGDNVAAIKAGVGRGILLLPKRKLWGEGCCQKWRSVDYAADRGSGLVRGEMLCQWGEVGKDTILLPEWEAWESRECFGQCGSDGSRKNADASGWTDVRVVFGQNSFIGSNVTKRSGLVGSIFVAIEDSSQPKSL